MPTKSLINSNEILKKISFILSDESVNSYGFAILTAGINLSNFRKNPVMLMNHDANCIMGKWENIRVEGTKLIADAVFDEKDPEAMKMYNKAEQGMLNCASVSVDIQDAQKMEGMECCMPGQEDTPIVTLCNMLECSVTPTPSNSNALKCFMNGELINNDQVVVKLSNNLNQKKITTSMKKLAFFIAALEVAGVKLSADSTEDDLLKTVQQLSAKHANLVEGHKAVTTEKESLTTKLTALQLTVKNSEKAKITELVDGAIKAGKLTADKKEQYEKLAAADFPTTKEIIDGMKAHTSLSSQLNEEKEKTASTEKYKDWGLKQLHKEAPKELARIKAEEPDRYKQLIKENA